jgi:hypothetical protein
VSQVVRAHSATEHVTPVGDERAGV